LGALRENKARGLGRLSSSSPGKKSSYATPSGVFLLSSSTNLQGQLANSNIGIFAIFAHRANLNSSKHTG
jgi:hypothetical protein